MNVSLDALSSQFVPGVKVFISHQRNDKHIALDVQKRLENMRIESFLDATDKGRAGYKSVTDWIVANLRKSTHMLVVYTNNTKSSEWVPFEIGMAYEREEGIAILDSQRVIDKPSYLNDFPLMPDMESLKYFASLCRKYSNAKETTLTVLKNSANEMMLPHLKTFAKEPVQVRLKTLADESMQRQLRIPLNENIQDYLTADFVPSYAKFFIDSLKEDLKQL